MANSKPTVEYTFSDMLKFMQEEFKYKTLSHAEALLFSYIEMILKRLIFLGIEDKLQLVSRERKM